MLISRYVLFFTFSLLLVSIPHAFAQTLSPNEKILELNNAGLFDLSGLVENEILVHDSVRLSSDVTNIKDFDVPFHLIAKIDNKFGTVKEIGMGGTALAPHQTLEVGMNWAPEERGIHIISLLAVNNIAEKKLLAEPKVFVITAIDPSLPSPTREQIVEKKNGDKYYLTVYADASLIDSEFDSSLKKLSFEFERDPQGNPSLIVEIPRFMLDDIYRVLHDGREIPFSLEQTSRINIVTVEDFNSETDIFGRDHTIPFDLFDGYRIHYKWNSVTDEIKVKKHLDNDLDIEFKHQEDMQPLSAQFKYSIPQTNLNGNGITSPFGNEILDVPKDTFEYGTGSHPYNYKVDLVINEINGNEYHSDNTVSIPVRSIPEFSSISLLVVLTISISTLIVFTNKTRFKLNSI